MADAFLFPSFFRLIKARVSGECFLPSERLFPSRDALTFAFVSSDDLVPSLACLIFSFVASSLGMPRFDATIFSMDSAENVRPSIASRILTLWSSERVLPFAAALNLARVSALTSLPFDGEGRPLWEARILASDSSECLRPAKVGGWFARAALILARVSSVGVRPFHGEGRPFMARLCFAFDSALLTVPSKAARAATFATAYRHELSFGLPLELRFMQESALSIFRWVWPVVHFVKSQWAKKCFLWDRRTMFSFSLLPPIPRGMMWWFSPSSVVSGFEVKAMYHLRYLFSMKGMSISPDGRQYALSLVM